MIRNIARSGLATLTVAAPLAASGDDVYLMQDGLLVVELESLGSPGDWALETDVAGHTGAGFLRWDGPNHFQDPGHDTIAVDFKVPETGSYVFRIRNHHDHWDHTEANDVWVRLDGEEWIKTFSGIKNQWTWATNHELDHDDKPPAAYYLTAGQHRLEFSGRSYDFRMDRFHVFTPGHPGGTDPSQPESPTEQENLRPVSKVRLDPTCVPADGGGTVVTLDGSQSFDPEGGPLHYRWSVRGAEYVDGTSSTSMVARVRLANSGFVQPVRLTVSDQDPVEPLSDSKTVPLGVCGEAGEFSGEPVAWHPVEVSFHGPATHENAKGPNPFLDYRLTVTWTGPSGQRYDVPGFYDGDGEGGGTGDVWSCRFSADEGGVWTWKASFRVGEQVAVTLAPSAGEATHFDGATGEIAILDRDGNADGFLALGRLENVGGHYRKFRDGGWFLKGGTDSPENLLGYAGFDDVHDAGGIGIVHEYPTHQQDWRPGDPEFVSATTGVDSKGIIGALNYLGDQGVNSVYFLPMNLGGDGQETYPFVGNAPTQHDRTHYDVSRLHQWAQVLDHAQARGVLLHFVLAETEPDNENWLDEGECGVERKLYYRELVARFGHALAVKWNLSEENDYTIAQLEEFAEWLRAVDPYDHAIAVHTDPDDFTDYHQLVGNQLFDVTSIQYTPELAGDYVEEWRERSAAAGHPWVLEMDENLTGLSGSNHDNLRKKILYDVYFSGGQLEWYAGYHELPLGGDVKLEDFRTRESMWRYMRIAREFMQDHLPFWEMEPADELVSGEEQVHGGAECLAKKGEVYAVYLPKGTSSGDLDLTHTSGQFVQRWFNPRTGSFEGDRRLLQGGQVQGFKAPPGLHKEDWVVLVTRRDK